MLKNRPDNSEENPGNKEAEMGVGQKHIFFGLQREYSSRITCFYLAVNESNV